MSQSHRPDLVNSDPAKPSRSPPPSSTSQSHRPDLVNSDAPGVAGRDHRPLRRRNPTVLIWSIPTWRLSLRDLLPR